MGNSDQSKSAGFRTPEQSLPDPLPAAPWPTLQTWLGDASRAVSTPNHNAMTLATVGPEGRPSARVVLCKIVRPDPGYIVFFTNYDSRKSEDLKRTPYAAACMHWDVLGRQIRIEGPVTRSPDAESDDYFASRSVEARLGAWASRQSRPIESREALLEQVADAMGDLHVTPSQLADGTADVPRPPFWGGWRLWASRIELWVNGPERVHDRAAWTRSLEPSPEGFAPGDWTSTRLQP